MTKTVRFGFKSPQSSPSQRAMEVEEQNGAADRDRQAAEVEARHVAKSQLGSDEPANQCTRDAEYRGDDDPAGGAARHEKLGQYARNQPEHDPRGDTHTIPPVSAAKPSTTPGAERSVCRHRDQIGLAHVLALGATRARARRRFGVGRCDLTRVSLRGYRAGRNFEFLWRSSNSVASGFPSPRANSCWARTRPQAWCSRGPASCRGTR